MDVDDASRGKPLQCWEFKQCGRTDCPAYVRNLGRMCWIVAGTMCGGKPQGSYAVKVGNCLKCDFYRLVARQNASEKKAG